MNDRTVLARLDERFGAWWGAFLLHGLETLKTFRAYGDDERQILVWAMATSDGRPGLPLSELATMTGIPVETARRHLLRLAQDGQCRREGALYAIDLPETLRAATAGRTIALARVLHDIVYPGASLDAEWPAAADAEAARVYLSAGLAYCASLRRRVTRGVFIPCVFAGMLEIESAVRHRRLLEGDLVESRQHYVEVINRLNWIVVHTARVAHLAGESMTRARAAVRYAGNLGFGTMVSPDHFAYSAQAAQVLRDEQALIVGVKERLAELVRVATPKTTGP